MTRFSTGPDGLYAYRRSIRQQGRAAQDQGVEVDRRTFRGDEGLSPGEHVIVAGQYKVQPGSTVATSGREHPTRRRPRPNEHMNEQHLGAVHSLPHRNLAADGGHSVRRPRRLSAAAGRAAAAGRLPDHPGLAPACPAPAPRPWPRRWRSRWSGSSRRSRASPQMTSTSSLGSTAITMQFDLNRNIDGAANDVQAAINAAERPAAEEPAEPADLPQGQSGRLADPAAVGDVGHAAADRGQTTMPTTQLAQQISQISGVAPGHHRRPAEAGGPHPDRSGEARRQGAVARGRPQPDRDHHRRQPEGQDRRRDAQLHHLRQRPADRRRRTGTTSSSPIATARRCASATSARRSSRPEDTKQAAWAERQARRRSSSSSSSPAPTSSRPSTGSRRHCRGCSAAIPPAIKIEILSDRTQTIRASVTTCSSRCCSPSSSW